MLTISQLAEYAGTTVRAIRHYHSIGLLPEPERNSSGYRSYGAQAIVDVRRIRILADAGVPLKRIGELVHATPDELRAAIAAVDRDLRTRIRELQSTRKSLAKLAAEEEPFLPPEVHLLHREMRELGISEQTITMEQEGWILAAALFPELMGQWLASQQAMMADPEYRDLYQLTDQAFGWDPDDPRIEVLVRRTLAFIRSHPTPTPADWDSDKVAYQLVSNYRMAESPGWARVMTRLRELMQADKHNPEPPDPVAYSS